MQKLNLNNIPEAPENKDFWVVGTANREGSIDSNSYKKNLKELGKGGSIDLNDRDALKALYSAMRDAVSLVLITEDLCVYDDDPSSHDKGTYTVSLPEIEIPDYMVPTFVVSGLFKDTLGYTHRLETLKLQWNEQYSLLVGRWEELNEDDEDVHYILELEPISATEYRMSIMIDRQTPEPE